MLGRGWAEAHWSKADGSAGSHILQRATFIMRTNHLLGLNARTPSAILGGLRANGDPATVLRQLAAAQTEHNSRHERELDNAQAALDAITARVDAITAGGGTANDTPRDPAYSNSFDAWFRRGEGEADLRAAHASGQRGRLMAAMSTGSATDGGYIAPVEWDRKITQVLRSVSGLRTVAQIQPTTVGAYSTVWSDGSFGSGWTGETASRPNTSTPNLAQIVFKAGEIYANPAISQTLVDDAGFNIENWLADEVSAVFAMQEGPAFISGDGINKPAGLLGFSTGGAFTHPGGGIPLVNSGQAANLTTDGLVDLVFNLPAQYRTNASWLMNSSTLARIRKFKDAGGQYLWQPSLDAINPDRILGYPVVADESMPDVAANALPIAFGDFRRGYVINDRTGLRILRDPYSSKPFVSYYCTRRVGGGVLDPRALRLQKIAA